MSILNLTPSPGPASVPVQPGRAVQLCGDGHRAPHCGHPGQPPPHRLPQWHIQWLPQLQVPQMVSCNSTSPPPHTGFCVLIYSKLELCSGVSRLLSLSPLARMSLGPWTREFPPLQTLSYTTTSGLIWNLDFHWNITCLWRSCASNPPQTETLCCVISKCNHVKLHYLTCEPIVSFVDQRVVSCWL